MTQHTSDHGAHTPGPFCEQCIVTENHDLVFCSLHAAAPMLLEALEGVLQVHFPHANIGELPSIKKARAAILQATAGSVRAAKGGSANCHDCMRPQQASVNADLPSTYPIGKAMYLEACYQQDIAYMQERHFDHYNTLTGFREMSRRAWWRREARQDRSLGHSPTVVRSAGTASCGRTTDDPS